MGYDKELISKSITNKNDLLKEMNKNIEVENDLYQKLESEIVNNPHVLIKNELNESKEELRNKFYDQFEKELEPAYKEKLMNLENEFKSVFDSLNNLDNEIESNNKEIKSSQEKLSVEKDLMEKLKKIK